MNSNHVLQMSHISKRFAGIIALDDVSFQAKTAKVNILIGENGAGKSTLMKVLAGAIQMDSGEIMLNDQATTISSPEDAIEKGVAMIYQELNLVQDMSVAENIIMGSNLSKTVFFNKKKTIQAAQAVLEKYQIEIDPTELVKNLSIAKQQQVEIAKALARNVQILVMDEPTSSLSAKDAEHLLSLITSLKEQGVTIIYISHRMEEIFAIGDYVTVMCDGKYVGDWPMSEVTENMLVAKMVGREIAQAFPKEEIPIGDKVLEIKNLTKQGMYQDISFDVKQGEILGISGLVGAGRTEICLSIFGAMPYDSGEIYLNGEQVFIKSPNDAMKNRIAYVPEDRKALGVNLNSAIRDNISIANQDKISAFGVQSRKKENELGKAMVEKLNVKCRSIMQMVGDLSGGNQQKVVLAKWIARDLDVLILDEPTRGIDVGAKEEIHKLIMQFAKQGLAVIMISSELPEILGMSDRVIVIHEGKISAEINREEATQQIIMAHATGIAK